MDMDRYRALFIEESREHLAALSRLLVELEGSSIDPENIAEIFRRAHSIKGMAASMGYEPIALLSHRVEDVVALYRDSQNAVPAETVDVLLQSVDALTEQVDAIANGQTLNEYHDLIGQLGIQLKASGDAEAVVGSGQATVKLVLIRLDEACSSFSVRGFLVHRKIGEMGEILDCDPAVAEMKAGEVETPELQFVVRTSQANETLVRTIQAVSDVVSVEIKDPEKSEGPPTAVAKPAEESAPVEPTRVGANTVRVRTDVLDRLIEGVGELLIARERLASLVDETASAELRGALDSLGARIRDIHAQFIGVRMTPMRGLVERYPRIVRDLSRHLAKDVTFQVEGDEIELDRAILEELDTPFMHTIRNAIDHGIESPAERAERRKEVSGVIRIVASRDRDSVVVVVEDDGRGLDPEKLKKTAVAKELISDVYAQGLTDEEALSLICLPGFSTKTEVSGVSGRGVGMDVVRAQIEALGGSLDIQSRLGKGTRFVFRLPLTLAIVNVLLVQVHGFTYAIPVAKILAIRPHLPNAIKRSEDGDFLSGENGLAKVYDLATLLGHVDPPEPEQLLLVEDSRSVAALAVTRVVGYYEAVVKPLGEPLERLDFLSGATMVGDGKPILILDVQRVIRREGAGSYAA